MATVLLVLALCVTVSFGAEPLLDDSTEASEDEVSTTPYDYDDETTPPDTTTAPLPTTPPPAPPDRVFHNSTPDHASVKWADSPLNATTSSVGVPIHPSTSSVGANARASVFRVSSVGAVCLMCIVAIFCGLALNAF